MAPKLSLLSLLALALVPAAAQAEASDPAARLTAYNAAVVAIMKQKLSLAARADRFEPLVRSYYDMAGITQIVAGTAWAAGSAADRSAAVAALTRHSAVTLARNFDSFNGERFTVDPAVTSRAGDRVVKVTITAKGSDDTLLYRMRQGADGWKILDVISDGVSQLAVQRSDVASTLAAGGVAGLAKRLTKLDAAAH